MRKIGTVTALFLLTSTVLLAGCSGNDGSAPNGNETKTSAPVGTSAATAAAPVTVKVFAHEDTTNNQKLESNAFSKLVEQKFNFKFNWTAVPYDGAPEKRQISLASGDYPDAFVMVPYVDSFTQSDLLRYGQQGVFIPLNGLIDKYAPHIKEALDSDPNYKAMNTAPDGKIYGLNQHSACYHCSFPNKMWVNSKWMTQLGIEAPKTTEDFKKMLEAFKTKDPNQNGTADEIPLTGSIESFGVHVVPFLMNAFIYDDDRTYLMMQDGKVKLSANTPEWKEGLTYIKSLYDEGLIDPGAFTQNADAFKKIGENAPQLLGAGAGMHPAIFVDIADGNRYSKDYNSITPLTGPNGKSYATYSFSGNPGASFVITNKASEAAQIAMIKTIDYLFTFEGQISGNVGVKEVDWRNPQDGEVALDSTVKPEWATMSQKSGEKPRNNSWGSMSQYSDFRNTMVQSTDIYKDTGYERRLFEATKKNYDGHQPDSIFPYWAVWIDPNSADQAGMLKTNLNSYIEQNALQFITGNKNLNKDWDAYVKGFDGLDLNSYLNIMQKAYDSSTYKKH